MHGYAQAGDRKVVAHLDSLSDVRAFVRCLSALITDRQPRSAGGSQRGTGRYLPAVQPCWHTTGIASTVGCTLLAGRPAGRGRGHVG